MKKIFLILLLILIPGITFSQTMFLKKLDVKDSIYSTSGTGIINMSEFYKNGVPFSSGGGDVYLGNRQTFAARNVFNDSLISNSYSEFDNLKITNYINFLGDVISDLGFLKGATIRIGTLDNYGMQLRTADTNRIVIDSLGRVDIFKHTNFYEGIQAVGDITTFGNLTAAYLWGDGSNITDLNGSNITSGTISSSRLPTITRSIVSYQAAITTTPADATTYYWGSRQGQAPTTAEGFARIYFPVSCTIKSAIVYLYSGGAGTSETISYSIRKNATTDYSIGSGQATTAAGFNTAVLNGSMTVPISAGDWVEFKAVCPTWATNPTNIFFQVTIGIE